MGNNRPENVPMDLGQERDSNRKTDRTGTPLVSLDVRVRSNTLRQTAGPQAGPQVAQGPRKRFSRNTTLTKPGKPVRLVCIPRASGGWGYRPGTEQSAAGNGAIRKGAVMGIRVGFILIWPYFVKYGTGPGGSQGSISRRAGSIQPGFFVV